MKTVLFLLIFVALNLQFMEGREGIMNSFHAPPTWYYYYQPQIHGTTYVGCPNTPQGKTTGDTD